MTTAIFVRHGQSTGNMGIPSDDLAEIELTEIGQRQSRELAASWTDAPSLIVISPYRRTQQTAAATIARFSDVPVEVWPIEEFTYLEPSRWNGTRSVERMPYLERYWSALDPEYCDGPGAESFATLIRRAEGALERLASLPTQSIVLLFSHGQFIQAIRAVVAAPGTDDQGKMRGFWRKGEAPTIRNAQCVTLHHSFGCWALEQI